MGEENNSQHTLSPGNPLLGFGVEKRRFPRAAVWIFAFVCAGVAAFLFIWEYTLPFPAEVPFFALTRNFDQAPEYFPGAWRDAAGSHLPAALGVSLQNGAPEVFAVVPRWKKTDLPSTPAGIYKVVGTEKLELKSKIRLKDLLADWGRLIWHQAYVTLKLPDKTLRGSFDAGVWVTDLSLAQTPGVSDAGDLSLDLEAFPEAWPPIAQALAQSTYALELSKAPSALNLELTADGISGLDLTFSDFSSQTEQEISAALGKTDERNYTLPDDTVVKELLLPNVSSTGLFGSLVKVGIRQGALTLEQASSTLATDAEVLLAEFSPGILNLGLKELSLEQTLNCTLRFYRIKSGFLKIECN